MGKLTKALEMTKLMAGAVVAGADVFDNRTEQGTSVNVNVQKEQSELIKALLNHEVTEETIAMADRTLWVNERADEVGIRIKNGVTEFIDLPRNSLLTKPDVYQVDGWNDILIMDTMPSEADICDYNLPESGKIKDLFHVEQSYPLKTTSEYYPKYYPEIYAQKIVIKENVEDSEIILLGLYFSSYPLMTNTRQKMFTSNIEQVYAGKQRIQVLFEPSTIEFTTQKVWGVKNNIRYKYSVTGFHSIVQYTGYFVVNYIGKLEESEDLTEKFRSPELRQKYANKEKRPNMNIPYGQKDDVEVCSVCGREMEGIERADARIAFADYGVYLCMKCLKKYLKNKENVG